jgi:hypothetical protein
MGTIEEEMIGVFTIGMAIPIIRTDIRCTEIAKY